MAGRIGGGLPEPDADPRQHQREKGHGHPREHRHHRPGDQSEGQQRLARHAVGQPASWDADDGEQHCERRPEQHPDLPVGQLEVLLDALGQDRDDVPIHVVEEVRAGQDQQRVERVPLAQRGGGGAARGRRG
jgi:hypothetical protein